MMVTSFRRTLPVLASSQTRPREARPRFTPRVFCGTSLLLLFACLSAPGSAHASGACDPCGACTPEDLDVSGAVDGDDLGVLLAAWGSTERGHPADLTQDGVIDGDDISALLSAWSTDAAQACLGVTGFSPTGGAAGTTVTLTGSFPDGDPANYSVSAVDGSGRYVPFRVVSVTPTELVTVVGPVASDVTAAHLVVTLGAGTVVPPVDLPNQYQFTGDSWVFSAGSTSASASAAFTPQATSDAAGGAITGTFFGAIDDQGGLAVTMEGTCEATTRFRIWMRTRHTSTGESDPAFGYDSFIPCVQLGSEEGQPNCGLALCTILELVYGAPPPAGITVDCTVSPSGSSAVVAFYVDQGSIDAGAFIIEIVDSCDVD